MSTKRALLVGINYLKNPSARLNGCIEDINNIRGVIMDAYGYLEQNITMLRDDDPNKTPTKANIMVALQSIIANTGVNDEIWVHYSGHGTQIRDRNGDEPDGADESVVPVDYMTAGMISDDELFNMVRNIRGRAFLVFDSCHSGSICDLQYSINYVNGAFSKSITSNKRIANPNIVVMSGCRDHQTSADTFDNTVKEFGGALTISLIDSLRKNLHNADVLKVYNDTCYTLITAGYDQIPVLSSSAIDPLMSFSRPVIIKPVFVNASKPTTTSTVVKKEVVEVMPLVKTRKPTLAMQF